MSRGDTRSAQPRDRFDRIPDDLQRSGAHRAARRRRGALWGFGWAALATGLLVVAGVFGIFLINDRVSFNPGADPGPVAEDTPSSAPEATATVDPAAFVQVLNGTPTSGLASRVAERLTAAGFSPDITAASASEDTITESTVYYSTADLQGVALGVAETLGLARTELSTAFDGAEGASTSKVTVVLGADYVEPAA